MSEELHDGEFWLPSQFLTDYDILSDFSSASDDDHHLPDCAKLTPVILSTSPQSTLFGCDCNNHASTSSLGSPKELQKNHNDQGNETLELLNKAKIKLTTSDNNCLKSVGTGFFDCSISVKGRFCPPSTPPLNHRNTPLFLPPPPFYSHPQFRLFAPQVMLGAVQLAPSQQAQNKATKNNNNKNGNNRPLGLPPSAWPPLPGQTEAQPQAQAQAQAKPMIGTGVFLPRTIVTPPPAPKKKSDGNATKTKNNKASQRRDSRSTKAKDDEIQLPSEWVY